MVQENEYYNFSETASAYLNFVANRQHGQISYNTTGNLDKFVNVAKNYGLCFENEVSNDLLLMINENNYKNYNYI